MHPATEAEGVDGLLKKHASAFPSIDEMHLRSIQAAGHDETRDARAATEIHNSDACSASRRLSFECDPDGIGEIEAILQMVIKRRRTEKACRAAGSQDLAQSIIGNRRGSCMHAVQRMASCPEPHRQALGCIHHPIDITALIPPG